VRVEPDQQAVDACRYFHEVCAPTLVNYGSASFWSRLVLQACETEESIKHLVIAAAQLDMKIRQPSLLHDQDRGTSFQSHYGKALRLISQARSPDAATVLIACLLLMLCEELQQNHFPAIQHLIAGRKIITAHYSLATSQRQRQNSTIEEISHIFSKLELQTSEFHKHLVPAHNRLPTYVTNNDLSETNNIQQHLSHSFECCVLAFANIDECALSLQTIASTCTGTRLPGPPPRTKFRAVATLTPQLNNWYARYSALERSLSPKPAPKTFSDLNLLRIYHLCLEIISRCAPFEHHEMAYDGYATNIELVMVSCGILMTTTTTTAKLLAPLFFVATKYRGVDYRRRAIAALRRCGADGHLLADIAMRIVRVEERGLRRPVVCSDVPEQNRVLVLHVELDATAQFYTVCFRRCCSSAEEEGEWEEEVGGKQRTQREDQLTFPSQAWAWGCPKVISPGVVSCPPRLAPFTVWIRRFDDSLLTFHCLTDPPARKRPTVRLYELLVRRRFEVGGATISPRCCKYCLDCFKA